MQGVTCQIQREADVYVAISRGRDLSNALQFGEIDRSRIEIIILELTRNILAHAGQGQLVLEPMSDGAHHGLAIIARDQGPGIPDIELAMQDGFSTRRSLGAGLPGVRRLADQFAIESTPGIGTTVRAVKWVQPVGRTGYRQGGHA